MGNVDVNTLQAGQEVEHSLVFLNDLLAFPEGTVIEKEDMKALDFWQIESLKEFEELSFNDKGVGSWFSNARVFIKELQELYEYLETFFEEIVMRGAGSFGKVKSKFTDIYAMLRQEKDLVLFIINNKFLQKESLVMGSIEAAIYSMVMGMTLKLDEEKIKNLYNIALLIDLGMLKMKKLLNKKEKLTAKEKALLLSHPVQSYKMVKDKYGIDNIGALTILTHHENYDGTGYPQKLPNDRIPLYSQIIAIAQEFSALCQKRSYRKRRSLYEAMRILMGEGRKKFNPVILSAFLANMSLYPIGSLLYLSDDGVAVVVRANSKVSMRPVVKPILDSQRNSVKTNSIIDLGENRNLMIKKVIHDPDLERDILEYFDESSGE